MLPQGSEFEGRKIDAEFFRELYAKVPVPELKTSFNMDEHPSREEIETSMKSRVFFAIVDDKHESGKPTLVGAFNLGTKETFRNKWGQLHLSQG